MTTIKKMVMKWNIEDAQKTVRRARYNNTLTRKKFFPILAQENAVEKFNQILIKEREEYKKLKLELEEVRRGKKTWSSGIGRSAKSINAY